ncbi:hypothetical protein PMAYCL1PPCAC_09835 [Pristionchus mayeri]|uniref:Uncharacterized protein n=1 Tax=Pristionchus mayeri TaxID=1317129 RepID=A0AAN4ZL51_9BILA|nr:hypothetical protein PMAYCL1PPCAC_09835 [Pristionchus mayeri]
MTDERETTSSDEHSSFNSFTQSIPGVARLPHPLRIALNHVNEATAYASQWVHMLYTIYLRDSKSVWSVVIGIVCFCFFLISGFGLLVFFLLKTVYDVLLTQPKNENMSERQLRARGAWRGTVVICTIFMVSAFTGWRIAQFHSLHLL